MNVVETPLREGATPSLARVGFDEKPFDIFLIGRPGHQLVGRKTAAVLDSGPPKKCCLVEPSMVMGHFAGVKVSECGYDIYYHPCPATQAEDAFRRLGSKDDLAYPFARFAGSDRQETAQPAQYWSSGAAFMDELDQDEIVLRNHAGKIMNRLGIASGTVYDPACSTGAFLEGLKAQVPGIRTVGQDQSEEMVEKAQGRVDQVFLGNSLSPGIPPASAELVAVRHLNLDVVTTSAAEKLFDALIPLVRPGGHMFVTGHTPVLLASEWLALRGFEILERVGKVPGRLTAFQFYVLRRLA